MILKVFALIMSVCIILTGCGTSEKNEEKSKDSTESINDVVDKDEEDEKESTTEQVITLGIDESRYGYYSNSQFTKDPYVVLLENSVQYSVDGIDYKYTMDEYDIEYVKDDSCIYVRKDGVDIASILLWTHWEQKTVTWKVLDENIGIAEEYREFSAYKTDIMDYQVVEGYTNYDEKGPWGAIPHTDEIEKLLTDGFSDDYKVRYRQDMPAFGENAEAYSCEWYEVRYYGECGYRCNVMSELNVFEDEEIAKSVYTYQSGRNTSEQVSISLHGNKVLYVIEGFEHDGEYVDGTKRESMVYFAGDRHCIVRYYEQSKIEMYYYSKPFTAEECQNILDIENILASMANEYGGNGTYLNVIDKSNSSILQIGLSAMINDEGNVFLTEIFSKDGDTITGYGYDEDTGEVSFVVFTVSDDMKEAQATGYKYDTYMGTKLKDYQGVTPIKKVENLIMPSRE